MAGSKNSNVNRGEQQQGKNAGRKRVLVLEPRAAKPNLLGKRFRWADELS